MHCTPLAAELEQKGYKVKQIVTFGQPKVDPKEAVPEKIPAMRVVHPRDPAIHLFPGNEKLLSWRKWNNK